MNAELRMRGRPRDASVETRVIDAAISEIVERGIQQFSLVKTAERAGVAKGTVYLRWPSSDALLADVMLSISDDPTHTDRGSLRADILAVADILCGQFRVPSSGMRVMLRVFTEARNHPSAVAIYQRNWFSRQIEAVAAIFSRAQDRGEIPRTADPGRCADLLLGAFLVAWLRAGVRPLDAAACLEIAEHFLGVLGREAAREGQLRPGQLRQSA